MAIVGATMAGANACCIATSARLSTANEIRLEIQPGWFQSSQARFHLGKLAVSSSKQYSSRSARAWGPSTELISTCSTIDMFPDIVILPWGFHVEFRGNGVIRHWRFLCLIWAAPSIELGICANSKC